MPSCGCFDYVVWYRLTLSPGRRNSTRATGVRAEAITSGTIAWWG